MASPKIKTNRKGRCKSCGAAIAWATTKEGKLIPLNHTRVRTYFTVLRDDGTMEAVEHRQYDDEKQRDEVCLSYVSHFVSCPNATQHSKGGE